MDMTAVAKRIRSERKHLRLTQQQLADLAGLSDRTLRTIEKGETSASVGALFRVLDTLGLDIEVRP